ncbi:MAG: helix-turn-helix domain-containing protein, partial [Thauera sp.]|nr:helix-turn-helix domain-containing protein [Thauera sp.]
MRLPCAEGECFLPADRVATGRNKPGRVGYALACFIFRFLRRPLKDARLSQKLSQGRVADKVGIRQDTVSSFELNPESTKLDTLF